MSRIRSRRRGGALVENALLVCLTCALSIPVLWRLAIRTNDTVEAAIEFNSHPAMAAAEAIQNPFAGESPPAGGPTWHQGDAPQWP